MITSNLKQFFYKSRDLWLLIWVTWIRPTNNCAVVRYESGPRYLSNVPSICLSPSFMSFWLLQIARNGQKKQKKQTKTYACISCHWALFPYNLCSVGTFEGILLQQMYLPENTTCSHECMGSWTFFPWLKCSFNVCCVECFSFYLEYHPL